MYSMVVIRSINGELGHDTMPLAADRPIHQPKENATGEPGGLSLSHACASIPMSTPRAGGGAADEILRRARQRPGGPLGLAAVAGGSEARGDAQPGRGGGGRLEGPLSDRAMPVRLRLSSSHTPTTASVYPHAIRARTQLPSLSSLRMGAQQLLDWLFREYWQKQVGANNPSSSPPKKTYTTPFASLRAAVIDANVSFASPSRTLPLIGDNACTHLPRPSTLITPRQWTSSSPPCSPPASSTATRPWPSGRRKSRPTRSPAPAGNTPPP